MPLILTRRRPFRSARARGEGETPPTPPGRRPAAAPASGLEGRPARASKQRRKEPAWRPLVRPRPARHTEQRPDTSHQVGVFDGGLTDHRLDRDPAIALIDPVETADAIDVHQVSRPREAEVEERDERLAAGKHLRVLERTKQRARLLDGCGHVVLERGRFHSSIIATARHRAASPPWKRHGKQPNRILRSSTSSRRPPRFSLWITSCGNSSVCMIW